MEEEAGLGERESKQRRSGTPRAAKSSKDKEAIGRADDDTRQPAEPRRKETKEERKERKEREARKAAKEASRKHKHQHEGSSKGREEEANDTRKGRTDGAEGGSASGMTRASPRHKSKGGGDGSSDAPRASGKAAASPGAAKSKEGPSRGVKEGKQPKESAREDKGKGKAAMDDEEEPVSQYAAASKAHKMPLHTEVPADLPELKRLQKLLELAVEAESDSVRQHFKGRHAGVAEMFEEAASQFIIESEGITISKLKRAASRPVPAPKLQPNPINEQRLREEAKLKDTLAAFQGEQKEWERMMATKPVDTPALTFAALPPAGSMPPSSHALMHELSIAHRNMLSGANGSESELPELLAWAHGYIHSGLDKPRNAIAAVEERSNEVDLLHSKLIKSMRSTIQAPFGGASTNAKLLLRAVAAT